MYVTTTLTKLYY